MLDCIKLENFKAFRNLNDLKIKPITILCGTNSCGKSSILQSILLLKQTLESKNPNQTLLLNGRFIHLGNFENVIYGKKPGREVILKYCFKLKKDSFYNNRKRQPPLRLLLRDLIRKDNLLLRDAEYFFYYEVSLKTKYKNSKKYLNPILVNKISLKIETKKPDNEIIPEAHLEMNLNDDGFYEVIWENIHPRFSRKENEDAGKQSHIDVKFSNLFPTEIVIENEINEHPLPSHVVMNIYRFNDILKNIVSSYTYIGPLREEPSRRYIYEDEVLEIGVKGENAAYIYLAEQENVIKKHYFYDCISDSFIEKKSLKLSEALTDWFNIMKIDNFKPEAINEIIYLNLDSNSSKDTRVNIADVGFGVSQIFPIVLEGLRMSAGNTLLLEQPEIHLHPNLQMQMADYFISLALSNKKVIVETHSDHIINRLVRRIVEDDKFNLKDLIGIYFVNPSENGAIYEEICIDDKRGIINWPKDFFDQTATEQEKIMLAGLRKRKAAKKER